MSGLEQGIIDRHLKGNVVYMDAGHLAVKDKGRVRDQAGELARLSALGSPAEQSEARWLIWETAQAMGIVPASINSLYMARGRGEVPPTFTVPAMNLRMLAFDAARAVFRAAKSRAAGAIVFEIARSEIGYTEQRPGEYSASVLAAALAEMWSGPLFIQGDHFQVSAKKYRTSPEVEIQAIRDLIVEALAAGFFNIDIDTSTLVDLTRPTVREQQKVNAALCAEFSAFIRQKQPKGVEVSIGGEIGEVGGRNSTEEELRAFLELFGVELDRRSNEAHGVSKISIQTGTSHGGVVLPDGTIAQVAVDFKTLQHLSQVARKDFGLAGAVQHGASTLPEGAFRSFVEHEACEVHLATNFQNIAFDLLPADLSAEMYAWAKENCADERKPQDTEEQFLYKTRKRTIGPFKERLWNLPEESRLTIRDAWEKQFAFLFDQLCVGGTADTVARNVKAPALHRSPQDFGARETSRSSGPGDLAD
ncbi:MAG: class II fructose-bisphosphate aldolase [Anaerolineales bacterium]|jgi:fructose/tagatose bisphosphate aldolase